MSKTRLLFKHSAVAAAVASGLLPILEVFAQDTSGIEKIEVTATRRTGTVQEIPLNISALNDDVLAQQNIDDLSDIARWVPGLTIQDQGGRSGSPIIVRGLNTNPSGPDSDSGTVATYYGEIPLDADIRLLDVKRVEVLIGPQGTLYGAGTLGGALRYIPHEAELDVVSGKVYGEAFDIAQSDDFGGEAGFVFNTPLIDDSLALRVNFNYFNDPGFIDYNYIVQKAGVSLPDPDWNDEATTAQNLRAEKDHNGETTKTARIALRWAPTDNIDATLSYLYQKQETEGRSIVHGDTLSPSNPLSDRIGQYESAYRYEEPRDKEDDLLSLEVSADLGFAELVSATGLSRFEADGQRDQTDLLVRLDFGYEEFPAFSSFTRELDETDTFTQEIRLVSQSDSALSWITGFYFSKQEVEGMSQEFTPNFDKFAVENWGGIQARPDALEYLSVDFVESYERALFGELTYEISDDLNITLGMRAYEYEISAESAVDLPLYYTVFEGRAPDSVELELLSTNAKDNGTLFKFNVSYQATPEILTYFTASEGLRIGGANAVAACPSDVFDIDFQNVCALPEETLYKADTTENFELGFKSSWMRNKLHFNTALFYVDWIDPQVQGATQFGQQPIIINADSARARGVEMSSRAVISDEFTMYATFAYTQAELTSFTEALHANGEHGYSGDRLPGSPERQFSLGANYSVPVFDDKMLDINYGLTYQSDIITKTGLRDDGETLSGYALSNISARLSGESWGLTFYVDNLFDKYAVVSARRGAADITTANGADIQRNYGYFITTPRTIGLRFDYDFEL
ncbi:TonB-dependent receptor [Aestuariibacter sp. AA17]|uniref:TonB-dependent receptor n=1 Tax=Fluctibacter corallii TaxID=2984329 RepID=A0ABT3A6W5_9ALTE|nr:TonB-dependent receptor [Aestuariibacter sp. AA17]MCV2884421.1 TonB-dependent receptor [Aestuariibacter sp. AA17]